MMTPLHTFRDFVKVPNNAGSMLDGSELNCDVHKYHCNIYIYIYIYTKVLSTSVYY
jgi:hypothetical protein